MFNESLLQQFLVQRTKSRKFLIGYSGGLDSHVLLHAMSQLSFSLQLQLRAVHVHHGLSSNADLWSKHCELVCRDLQIPLIIKKISIQKTKSKSLEALAREARYHIFKELLESDEVLMTAHHKDDQAETLLLQLFRGAGTKGLAAMPESMPFAQSNLLRPLLGFIRTELHNYALKHQLNWVDDESNLNLAFDRNFVRHQLLPLIQQRWPNISHTLSRAARHCAEYSDLVEDFAELKLIPPLFNSITNSLSVNHLRNLDAAQQRNILRQWLFKSRLPIPSDAKLHELQRCMLSSRQDANPKIAWAEIEVRRYRDELYVMSCLSSHDKSQFFSWDFSTDLQLPNGLGFIRLQWLKKNQIDMTNFTSITIRFRQGGEKCRIKNRGVTHDLKKLFQEWGVPPWLRDRIPLLYDGEKLIAIYGYAVCE